MRLIAFIEYAALIIGVIAMIAGQLFALRKGFHLGVFMTGAGIALGGLEALVTRRMCFRFAEDAYEAHAGAPAMIVGLMALLVGAGLIAAAYLLAECYDLCRKSPLWAEYRLGRLRPEAVIRERRN